MRRREFIAAVSGAVTWPLTARAQQPGKLPVIGFLGATTPEAFSEWTAAFEGRLRELDFVNGRTVSIEYRWGNGRIERFGEIAAEFVKLKVDVIVTSGTPAVVAVKNATTIIPIVFALAGDPVATGLVASLSHPGGNVTGLSVQTDDVIGKRFDLLRQIVPTFRRLAVFANVESALVLLEVRDIQATARTLGVEVAVLEVRRAEDIEPVFAKLNGMADALYVCADPLVNAYRERMNALALAAHLPYARFARLCGTRGSHVLRAKHP